MAKQIPTTHFWQGHSPSRFSHALQICCYGIIMIGEPHAYLQYLGALRELIYSLGKMHNTCGARCLIFDNYSAYKLIGFQDISGLLSFDRNPGYLPEILFIKLPEFPVPNNGSLMKRRSKREKGKGNGVRGFMKRLLLAVLVMVIHGESMATAQVAPPPNLIEAKLEDNRLDFGFASHSGKAYDLEQRLGQALKEAVRTELEESGFEGSYLPEDQAITRPTILFIFSSQPQKVPCEKSWYEDYHITVKLIRPVTFATNGIFHEVNVTVYEDFQHGMREVEGLDTDARFLREFGQSVSSILRVLEASNRELLETR